MNKKELKQRVEELEEEVKELKEQIERNAKWNEIFPRNYPYTTCVPYWYVEPFHIPWGVFY